MAIRSEQIAPASVLIRDGAEVIAEIRDLQLCNVRLRPGGRFLIGSDVPVPLFWEQYAHHQDPERNAGSRGRVRLLPREDDYASIECTGATLSGSAESRFEVTFRRGANGTGYLIEISCSMRVTAHHTWSVSPNTSHGEVEFCNLWPDGVFSSLQGGPVLAEGCYVDRKHDVVLIPHHHVESSDKHNIPLHAGDRMVWLLGEENLCVSIHSPQEVTAGICAYMWDAHLGYKVCVDGTDRLLASGTLWEASYTLTSLDPDEVQRIVTRARIAVAPEFMDTPAIVEGEHTFAVTCGTSGDAPADVWPWETEVGSGDPDSVRFRVDPEEGWDDAHSLRIDADTSVIARWKATALGPAFRHAAFVSGERYRLVAYVHTALREGAADIAVRIHQTGRPGMYDVASYLVVRSAAAASGRAAWTRLEVTIPPLVPAADRIHLLLELRGSGTCWFDNVLFERMP